MFLGQYREPPSNEEMILYFYQHEAEFEQLVADYYALIKYFYDYKKTSMHDRSEMLRFQMAELGIRRVSPGGGLSYRIQFMAIKHFKNWVCICTCLTGAVA